MEFRLTYRGPLKSNGGPKEKQRLRREFHPQLKRLWDQPPLSDVNKLLSPVASAEPNKVGILERVGDFVFAPLVSSHWHTVAEINVLFLRPSPPGQLVGHGGDLDNRIKTLLDALRMPIESELPRGDIPQDNEDLFFCLLQDDALITGLSVATDRLLDSGDPSEVLLVIRCVIKVNRTTFENLVIW